jgi:hypothetical protein
MANYREQTVSETIEGQKWTRAYNVNVSNRLDEIPSITFAEEEVTQLSNGTKSFGSNSSISESFANPNTEFELLNPITGLPVGIYSKYSDVYVMLYSMYMHLATIRDANLNNI